MNTAICITLLEDMRLTMPNNKIVIKMGGGLITDKSQYKAVLQERIDAVCKVVAQIKTVSYTHLTLPTNREV